MHKTVKTVVRCEKLLNVYVMSAMTCSDGSCLRVIFPINIPNCW